MHIKRQLTPKKWPIVKKGTAYIVKPNFNSENGLTILTILRDILKIAQTRKEVKKAIFSKNVLLNSKPLKDEKHSAVLVYDGKHTGKEGTVENIDKNHKIAELKIPDGKINVLIKQIIVTE